MGASPAERDRPVGSRQTRVVRATEHSTGTFDRRPRSPASRRDDRRSTVGVWGVRGRTGRGHVRTLQGTSGFTESGSATEPRHTATVLCVGGLEFFAETGKKNPSPIPADTASPCCGLTSTRRVPAGRPGVGRVWCTSASPTTHSPPPHPTLTHAPHHTHTAHNHAHTTHYTPDIDTYTTETHHI